MERTLLSEVSRGALLAVGGLSGIGLLLMAAQIWAGAPVVPGPRGAVAVLVGLAPAVLAVTVPVGLLAGVVAVGQRWAEGGEALGLAASGFGVRRLAPGLVALGLGAAGLEAGLTHGAEPAGRAMVRRALDAATGDLSLRAGQPTVLGEALVHAAEVEGRSLGGLFLAAGPLVVTADAGRFEPGGVLSLERGEARRPGDETSRGWQVTFEAARLPLEAGARRVELAERSTSSLVALIGRMRAAGRTPAAEQLALYKRTTLPLSLPLLGLLGLPLGARGVRPALAATLTALGWWVALRVCDQAVGQLGAILASAIPPGLLAVAVAASWASWRDR